jgi:hypothetical protein
LAFFLLTDTASLTDCGKILSSPHAIADSTCEIGGFLRKRALLSIFFSLLSACSLKFIASKIFEEALYFLRVPEAG